MADTSTAAQSGIEAVAVALLSDQRGDGLPVLRRYIEALLGGEAPVWPHEITEALDNDLETYRAAMEWESGWRQAELIEQHDQDRETARLAYGLYRFRRQAPLNPYDEDVSLERRLAIIVMAYHRDLLSRTYHRAQREARAGE